MRWRYRLIEKSRRLYIYAYSRESDDLDGRIAFDIEKNSVSMMRPSKADKSSQKAQAKALEHFGAVILKDFPEEHYVCCG